MTGARFSKKAFKRKILDENKKLIGYDLDSKIDQFVNWIPTLDYKKLGIIRYNQIDGNVNFFQKLDNVVHENDGGEIAYFGNLRGINRIQDVDALLVIGGQRIPGEYPRYSNLRGNLLTIRKDSLCRPAWKRRKSAQRFDEHKYHAYVRDRSDRYVRQMYRADPVYPHAGVRNDG